MVALCPGFAGGATSEAVAVWAPASPGEAGVRQGGKKQDEQRNKENRFEYNSGPAVRIWENQTSVFNASPGYICFHMLLSCVNSHIEFKK